MPNKSGIIAFFLLVCFLLFGSQSPAWGSINIIRVATTGMDHPSCGSDDVPCKTIQQAVNLAFSGDIITVAAGSYSYNEANDQCNFLITRAVVCFVDKHITLLGGYRTDDWLQAYPEQNVTIIDGQNLYRGIAIVAYNTMASIRLEGFTIQNGLAQGGSVGDDYLTYAFGGGLWAQNSSVTLKKVIFKNNKALGGQTAQAYGGGGSGGAVAIQSSKYGVPSELEDVVFEGNQASGGNGNDRGGVALGGGLFVYDSPVNGTNLSFIGNRALAGHSSGSGLANGLQADALGGGCAFQNTGSVSFSQVTARGNFSQGGNAGSLAGASGGGAFGGFLNVENSTLSLANGTISGNWARGGNASTGGVAMGGGFMTNSSNANLTGLQVINNAAISGASTTGGDAGSPLGGGGHVTHFNPVAAPTIRIENSIIADNRVEVGSPGRYIGGGGAGLLVQALTADIVHSTFARNYFVGELTLGQAILVLGLYGTSGPAATANIYNTIVSDHAQPANSVALTVFPGSTANLATLMFAGNANNTNSDGRYCLPGVFRGLSTVLNVPAIGYVSPGYPHYNYHLLPSSPAVDKVRPLLMALGTVLDIDGQNRPYGNGSDIGADELSVSVFTVTPNVLALLTSGNAEQVRYLQTAVNGTPVNWTASTTAAWLFLGPAGNGKEVTGLSGEELVVRFAPDRVGLGSYEGSIAVSGTDLSPQTITVRLIKVEQIHQTYLPLVSSNNPSP